MKVTAAAIILLTAASGAAGQTSYYQCTDDRGRPVFSQRPCGEDAQQVTIEAPGAAGNKAAERDTWDRVSAGNALREAERALKRSEARITSIERERDQKIAALKSRSNRANNNLAGGQYMESLATEMQAVTSQYQSKLDREYREQDRLREQMERTREAL